MPTVKKPITVRLDPTLLEQLRVGAARENRSVTNFIETALREQLSAPATSRPRRIKQSRFMNGYRR
jgi:hypothetical protein